METCYLQFGHGTKGPFLTRSMPLKHEAPDNYFVLYEGRWRKVFFNLSSSWIMYGRERINVFIEGA